jgi:site-specific DNA recombinase
MVAGCERDVLPRLDDWLAREFRPHRIEATILAMADAHCDPDAERAVAAAHQMIAESDARMGRYRAAIDAGGDLQEITQWINSAKSERLQAEAALRATKAAPRRMTAAEIEIIVEQLAGLAALIRDADPVDKAAIYKGLNLTLTYRPTSGTIRAKAQVSAENHGVMVGVRGGT